MTYDSSLERVLAETGMIVVGTVGTSMRPLLVQRKTAAVIRALDRESGELRSGDVVLFRRGDKLILHRIVQVEKDGFGLCGDNRWKVEHGVRREQILGVMTAFIRDGKETSVTDPEYLRYVENVLKSRGKRALRHHFKKVKTLLEERLTGR